MRRKLEDLFGLDVRSLALFRIGLGIVLLCDLSIRFADLEAHYTDDGVVPILAVPTQFQPISIHLIDGSLTYQSILFYLHGFAALALTVGWKTRYAAPIAWFLTLSVQSRNPMITSGGDTVLRLWLFWGMFLPLGACYSLDSLRRPPPPKRVLSMAGVALMLQFCLIYWFAALTKYDPLWRTEGYALYMALTTGHFTTPLGKIVLEHRDLMQFLTFATLVQEGIIPFLLFIPWKTWLFRMIVVVTFIGFHAGIGLTMELGIFQPVCIIGWTVFLPSEFWDWLSRRRRSPLREGLTLYHDAGNGAQKENVRFWTTLLMLGDVQVRHAQEDATRLEAVRREGTWIAVDRDGKTYAGYDTLLLLFRVSLLFRPFGYFLAWKPVRAVGEWLTRRRIEKARTIPVSPPRPDLPSLVAPLSGPMNLLLTVLMVYVFLWNFTTWNEPNEGDHNPVYGALLNFRDVVQQRFPPQSKSIASSLGLEQYWSLFASRPGDVHGWFVVIGTLNDGRQVDLFRGGMPVTWEKPEYISRMYRSERWRVFFMRFIVAYPSDYPFRHLFAVYLTDRWNSEHPEENDQLKTVEIFLMEEVTQMNYEPHKRAKVRMCKLDCKTMRSDLTVMRSEP